MIYRLRELQSRRFLSFLTEIGKRHRRIPKDHRTRSQTRIHFDPRCTNILKSEIFTPRIIQRIKASYSETNGLVIHSAKMQPIPDVY